MENEAPTTRPFRTRCLKSLLYKLLQLGEYFQFS